MTTTILGIDVSKRKFDVALLKDGKFKTKVFDNTDKGFVALCDWLSRYAAGSVHACLEATGNYGEAGAIDRYGPSLGLPQAYSGHNNFWLWGPPPAADRSAIVIGLDPSVLHGEFVHVRRVATFYNGMGIADDEQGSTVYLATGLREPWARAWPAFRDYS